MKRSDLVSGAGSLLFGTQKLFVKEDIKVTPKVDTFNPQIATHGKGAPRFDDGYFEISGTPTGRITQAIVDLLFPAAFANPVQGMKLFPSADVALKVHGMDGKALTFPNAAVSKPPELLLSPGGTVFGELTLTALVKDDTARDAAGALYVISTEAWSEAFNDDDIICVPYSALYDSVAIPTKDGFKISIDISVDPIKNDEVGTMDFFIDEVTVKASCTPIGWNVDDLLGGLPLDGIKRGASLREGKDLVITGGAGGLVLSLYDAIVQDAPIQYAPKSTRADTVQFVSTRKLEGVAPNQTIGSLYALTIAV